MLRMAFQGVVLALAAASATACLGGQTGEPGSGLPACPPQQVVATAPWQGTTVKAAVQVFTGQYRTPLQWQQERLGASDNPPVAFQDDLTLTVDYVDADARVACNGKLDAPVTVTVTTSASGLAESGAGNLEVVSTSGALSAVLSFELGRVSIDAGLAPVATGTPPSGGMNVYDPTLPGKSAQFVGKP